METLNEFFTWVNGWLWGWPMIILLVGTHLYLTVRLRFPQRYMGKAIRLSMTRDKGSQGDVSQFSALMTSMAATIGTGNIIGVTTAVVMGGPGAVFWCWLTGILGIATKYAEGLLSIKYRVKKPDGKMIGGPMYAIERGMRCKWLAVVFAVCTFIASFGIGCMIQSNAIATVGDESFGWSPLWVGLILSLLIAGVVFFGIKGIAQVCDKLVPFMAAFYVVGCVVLLFINMEWIDDALIEIVRRAFTDEATSGGFVGSTIMVAMRFGVARGLFSNEAGMGSAPIVAAAAQTRNPVRQALVLSSSVFWDTVVVCALTGLVIVTAIMADNGVDSSASAALAQRAFDQIPLSIGHIGVGKLLLTIAIFTFSFSTILGWAYYGEKALEYLLGSHRHRTAQLVYRILLVLATFAGANWTLDLVWNFGDTANALMAIPNLICLIALSGVLVKETRYYLWEDRLEDKAPQAPQKGDV